MQQSNQANSATTQSDLSHTLWYAFWCPHSVGSELVTRHQGRKVRPDAAKLEARILEWTRRGPQGGTTHWSNRRLAHSPPGCENIR
jgi:hypothetical protein